MGKTITEKILARAAGLGEVSAGDEIFAKPDFVLAYDFPGTIENYIFRSTKEDFNITRLKEPRRFAMFIDHMVPPSKPEEEALHQTTRDWAAAHEVNLFERKGIGHQVAAEEGYATPGAFVLHHDGHISQLGAYGTLAFGVRKRLVEAFVRDRVSVTVPATVRVNLVGELHGGVYARDVFHHLIRLIGPSGCINQMLEIGGPGADTLSADGLQTITGLAMFVGAVSAIVNPNAARLAHALPRARAQIEPLYSDLDANYSTIHEVDLSALGPTVVLPPSPHNARDLSDYLGVPINAGYLGSCASGRIEELRVAAEILRGRTVKPGFSLNVVPTSQQILSQAAREGIVSVLVEAGAFVSSPSCDYCFGHTSNLAAGQKAVSTGTLNVPGRMGSTDAEIFLASAATVAATAIAGRLSDPRNYLAKA